MRSHIPQEAGMRSVVQRIMMTPEGEEFYRYMLVEWERLSTDIGKAPNNDLMRQFVGQAQGVRWVIEMLAEALKGQGPNANGLVPSVSTARMASGMTRERTGSADSVGYGSVTGGTDSSVATGSVRNEA